MRVLAAPAEDKLSCSIFGESKFDYGFVVALGVTRFMYVKRQDSS